MQHFCFVAEAEGCFGVGFVWDVGFHLDLCHSWSLLTGIQQVTHLPSWAQAWLLLGLLSS